MHEYREFARDAALTMRVMRKPGAVAGDPSSPVAVSWHGTRRRSPDGATILVAKIKRLPTELAHRIVGKRRQPILAAVLGPGPGSSGGPHDRADALVRDHVDPRHRRVGIAGQHDHVFAPPRSEAAESILMDQRRHRDVHCGFGRTRRRGQGVRSPGQGPPGLRIRQSQLIRQFTAFAAQDRTRRRQQNQAIGIGHAVAAQQEYATGPVLPGGPQSLVEQALELFVYFVLIADGMIVENDGVGAQSLEAPVLLGSQYLPHERHVGVLDHAHDKDRQVPRYPVRPQTRLAERIIRQQHRRCAQGTVGPQHERGQLFVELRLIDGQAEVACAHLRLGGGEREGPRCGCGVVVFLGERDRSGAARGNPGRKRQPYPPSRRDSDSCAQAQNRIEYCTGGARE